MCIWQKIRGESCAQNLFVRPEGVHFLHHPFKHPGVLKRMVNITSVLFDRTDKINQGYYKI